MNWKKRRPNTELLLRLAVERVLASHFGDWARILVMFFGIPMTLGSVRIPDVQQRLCVSFS